MNIKNKLSIYLPDKTYLKIKYKRIFGKPLDLDHPKTFNEKIQWLKLHDRNPLYTNLVDKYQVKEYISELIGKEYTVPTLGIWDNFDDIDFDSLPDQFVLKCTHDSGGLVICKDKSRLDISSARQKINDSLSRNYYYIFREWPYKNVIPRIIAEPYLEDHLTGELRDYKFFTFNGEPKILFVASDRMKEGEETKFDFFDMNYGHLKIQNGHPNSAILPERPQNFQLMKNLAAELSQGIPHVRVDFYEVNGKVYCGELTFSHFGGFVGFIPEKWDKIFGDWITLPTGKA